MKTIYLIACSKRKAERPRSVEHLYQGDLFAKSLAYARLFVEDKHIRVLSARHYVLRLHQQISPYDETLNRMSARKRRAWGAGVTRMLGIQFGTRVAEGGVWPPMGGVHFVILAGVKYREPIVEMIEASQSTWEAPLAGLGIGEQLAWLNAELVKRRCRECGCTEDYACDGGCYWVEQHLCSECEDAAAGVV